MISSLIYNSSILIQKNRLGSNDPSCQIHVFPSLEQLTIFHISDFIFPTSYFRLHISTAFPSFLRWQSRGKGCRFILLCHVFHLGSVLSIHVRKYRISNQEKHNVLFYDIFEFVQRVKFKAWPGISLCYPMLISSCWRLASNHGYNFLTWQSLQDASCTCPLLLRDQKGQNPVKFF